VKWNSGLAIVCCSEVSVGGSYSMQRYPCSTGYSISQEIP
jgi:hypothetical protein